MPVIREPSENTRRYDSRVPFNNHARVEGLEADAGSGRTRIADLPELTNHLGTVHGGALFTVGEAASGRAMYSALVGALGEAASQLIAVTRTATIRFLKVAKGEINASALLTTSIGQVLQEIERSGRATANIDVKLSDAEGVVVAELSVEWHVRRPRDR